MLARDLTLLGLEPGASQAAIKKAYRRRARELHPDLTGDENKGRFQELQAAYARLMNAADDKANRSAGDGKRSERETKRRPASGMSAATESFFRDLGVTVAGKGAEHARTIVAEKVRSRGKVARAAAALFNVALDEGEAAIEEVLRTRK